jgi:hypothetical protein
MIRRQGDNNSSFAKLKLSSHVKISMFLHQIQSKELADSKMGKFLIKRRILIRGLGFACP